MHEFGDGSTVEGLTTRRDSTGTPSRRDAKLQGVVYGRVWSIGNGGGDAAGNQLLGTIMTLRWTRLGYLPASQPAPVAQLDRASASGAEGPAFESRLAHEVTTQASSW